MNILGIIAGDVGGHPSACLLKDGRLVAFVEEERLVRVKQAHGYFPSNAIRFCLREGKIGLDDVHEIAFGWDANAYRWRFPLFLAKSFLGHRLQHHSQPTLPQTSPPRPALGSAIASGLLSLISFQPSTLMERIVLGLREAGEMSDRVPPVTFIKHHLAHAVSAFHCSGFEESAVLVIDGHGEENTVTIWRGAGKKLDLLREINIPHSLGWFYSAFTEFLGWSPNEGEVKLMGLAPYGQPDPELDRQLARILQLTDDGVRLAPEYVFYGQRSYGKFFSDALVATFGRPRGRYDTITQAHRNLARAVQSRLEEAGIHLSRLAMRLAHSDNLCLAGGVALNCKMNGEIHKAQIAKKLFVQPISYDAGVSLGAAMALALDRNDDPRFTMDHLYLGPQYSNDQIEAALRANHIRYRATADLAGDGARLLAEGKIVGWFQGRLEAGPRALGGRSILADPRDPAMKDKVNDRVKFREEWRPFALSILEEHFAGYVTLPAPSPFMIMAYEVREDRQKDIASGMHMIDRTTRPQTVSKQTNKPYWDLIDRFRELTGVPAILNTSFNVKDEPIVCAPLEAVRGFYGTGMDALLIGDFIVEK